MPAKSRSKKGLPTEDERSPLFHSPGQGGGGGEREPEGDGTDSGDRSPNEDSPARRASAVASDRSSPTLDGDEGRRRRSGTAEGSSGTGEDGGGDDEEQEDESLLSGDTQEDLAPRTAAHEWRRVLLTKDVAFFVLAVVFAALVATPAFVDLAALRALWRHREVSMGSVLEVVDRARNLHAVATFEKAVIIAGTRGPQSAGSPLSIPAAAAQLLHASDELVWLQSNGTDLLPDNSLPPSFAALRRRFATAIEAELVPAFDAYIAARTASAGGADDARGRQLLRGTLRAPVALRAGLRLMSHVQAMVPAAAFPDDRAVERAFVADVHGNASIYVAAGGRESALLALRGGATTLTASLPSTAAAVVRSLDHLRRHLVALKADAANFTAGGTTQLTPTRLALVSSAINIAIEDIATLRTAWQSLVTQAASLPTIGLVAETRLARSVSVGDGAAVFGSLPDAEALQLLPAIVANASSFAFTRAVQQAARKLAPSDDDEAVDGLRRDARIAASVTMAPAVLLILALLHTVTSGTKKSASSHDASYLPYRMFVVAVLFLVGVGAAIVAVVTTLAMNGAAKAPPMGLDELASTLQALQAAAAGEEAALSVMRALFSATTDAEVASLLANASRAASVALELGANVTASGAVNVSWSANGLPELVHKVIPLAAAHTVAARRDQLSLFNAARRTFATWSPILDERTAQGADLTCTAAAAAPFVLVAAAISRSEAIMIGVAEAAESAADLDAAGERWRRYYDAATTTGGGCLASPSGIEPAKAAVLAAHEHLWRPFTSLSTPESVIAFIFGTRPYSAVGVSATVNADVSAILSSVEARVTLALQELGADFARRRRFVMWLTVFGALFLQIAGAALFRMLRGANSKDFLR